MVEPAKFHYRTYDRKLAPNIMVKTPPGAMRRKRPAHKPGGPYCSATYVSIEATCPKNCRFRGDGCYVTEGFTKPMSLGLDRAAAGMSGDEVIELEAQQIEQAYVRGMPQDGARGGRDLRLHIGGDVSSTLGAKRLARASATYLARGGGAVWTYTHRWKHIARNAWGPIAVLASVETPRAANNATLRGYASALVVQRFSGDKAFRVAGSPLRWIPCPAETRGTTCIECRLCLKADGLLQRGMGIAFAIHGRGTKRRLPVVGGKDAKSNL